MISYRHHVVSLVAVFLALAVGVVLGGGPLSEVGRADDATPASSTTAGRSADAERAAAYGDTFATAAAPTLYAGRLQDRPVALVTLPGADQEHVDGLVGQVEAAGGTVAGRYDVRKGLLDPTEKSLVDRLGAQLMTQVDDGLVDPEASTYVRLGQLMSLAVATTTETGEPVAPGGTAVRETLASAELLTAAEPDPARAPLVLVVLGDRADTDVLGGLLSGLAKGSTGVVVAGDQAAGRNGDLAGLRAEPVSAEVSSVDGVETTLGQVTAVLALARELTETGGAFGASGAEGAVPLG